jgi:hypothetical protein
VQELSLLDVTICPWRKCQSHVLFMSNKALFHLNGFVNAQKTCHWDTTNPHTIHEVQFHDEKLGVWRVVSGWRIIGPIFFLQHGKLAALCEQYFGTILKRSNTYLQQDNAMAHTSQHSMGTLLDVFGERIIIQWLQLLHSPDLSMYDFYMWGNLKQKAHSNNLLHRPTRISGVLICNITEGKQAAVSTPKLFKLVPNRFNSDEHHFQQFI